MASNKILIVEDEEAIADMLEYTLNQEGYVIRKTATGAEAIRQMSLFEPDLLLLDWMLPDLSGLDICREVTASHNVPILMITAKSDITDKVLGLEFGADDYITKPFDLREVVARVRTILRRVTQVKRLAEETASQSGIIRFRDIEIDRGGRSVRKSGVPIELTPKEYELLIELYDNRGKIFTRTELLEVVWGYDYAGDSRTVDTHILRLRKKLDLGDLIKTVFSVGYKFEKLTTEPL